MLFHLDLLSNTYSDGSIVGRARCAVNHFAVNQQLGFKTKSLGCSGNHAKTSAHNTRDDDGAFW